MSDHLEPSPINPLPPAVVLLFMAIMGVEAAFSLGAQGLAGGPQAVGWRLAAVQAYAFSGDIFDWMIANGRYPNEHLIRFVTYPFVSASFTHALVAGVMLLALGKMVGEVFASWAVLVVFVVSGAFGALVYGLVLDDPYPLLGAFPPVYGLLGAFTYLLWLRLGEEGAPQSRAFALIGFLMAIQLVFGLLFGLSNDWLADLAGFVAGFTLSFVVSPGGFTKLRGKLRHD
jgi:membrane associated rhomboid family serine protease